MMTIQQMVDHLKDQGFEVKKDWISRYQCQFVITKHDFGAISMYKWQPELSPGQITEYQQDFLKRIVNLWKDHYETELEQRMVKQALNSIYGKDACKEVYIHTSRPLSHLDIEKMAKANIAITKEPWTKMNPYTNKSTNNPTIKDVIFNNPATIVFWSDGTKTVVKCQEDDIYDPEKGLAMAISKKFFGNKGNYCNEIKKWMDKYEEQTFNPFQEALDKICESVRQVKITIPKLDITTTPCVTSTTGTTVMKSDTPKTMKVRATWEFEVDTDDFDPKHVDIPGLAKDVARNELRDLILKKEISADDFTYEIIEE